MLKNIFRNRRRSKNEPLHYESEHVPLSGSQLAITENVLSATDLRRKHTDAENINRPQSSSQLTGRGEKFTSGHSVNKHRLSSVVNKILRTRSESKPAPRIRRMVASDLYTPGFRTKEKSRENNEGQVSGTHHNEDAYKDDDVFAIPFSCQFCASITLRDDISKNSFSSKNSWICSQCRMQITAVRSRHASTASSPPALVTTSSDLLNADNVALLCEPDKLASGDSQLDVAVYSSHRKCNGNIKYKSHSVEKVTDVDDISFDALKLPSPLQVNDLECHESRLSDDDDDDIPELVEIYSQSCGSSCRRTVDTGNLKQHSSPVVQPAVETEGRSVNESEMYILTDSFLDDTTGTISFIQSTAMTDSSHSAIHSPPDVMVADDYELLYSAKTNCRSSCVQNASVEPVCLPSEKLYPQPDAEAENLYAVRHLEEQMWCRKRLMDWTNDDVLQWVVTVGLTEFYETFRSKSLHVDWCLL